MKTKVLISFAVTSKLICVFVFAYAKCLFSHDAAQLLRYVFDDDYRIILFISSYKPMCGYSLLILMTTLKIY